MSRWRAKGMTKDDFDDELWANLNWKRERSFIVNVLLHFVVFGRRISQQEE